MAERIPSSGSRPSGYFRSALTTEHHHVGLSTARTTRACELRRRADLDDGRNCALVPWAFVESAGEATGEEICGMMADAELDGGHPSARRARSEPAWRVWCTDQSPVEQHKKHKKHKSACCVTSVRT